MVDFNYEPHHPKWCRILSICRSINCIKMRFCKALDQTMTESLIGSTCFFLAHVFWVAHGTHCLLHSTIWKKPGVDVMESHSPTMILIFAQMLWKKPYLAGCLSKPFSSVGRKEVLKILSSSQLSSNSTGAGNLDMMSSKWASKWRKDLDMKCSTNVRGFGIGNIFLDNFSCIEQTLLLNVSEVLVLLPSKRESLRLKENSGHFISDSLRCLPIFDEKIQISWDEIYLLGKVFRDQPTKSHPKMWWREGDPSQKRALIQVWLL